MLIKALGLYGFIGLVFSATAQASPFPDKITVNKIADAPKRNIVFILTDDHRYDAMGFLAHPFMQTPNLDSIASEGVHFKNAMVTTSLCSPSRASILTGLYTHKHRVIDNNRLEQEGTVYFAEYLQQAGYDTAFLGKWHMGSHDDNKRKGFDYWVSFKGQGVYWAPDDSYRINVDGQHVPQKGYITDELTDYAIDWLSAPERKNNPFMMYLSHKAVHANFTPAERHKGMYEGKVSLPSRYSPDQDNEYTPRWVRDQRNSWHGVDFPYHSDKDITRYYQNYAETFSAVDDSIGRVKAQLKKMGVYDNTLIIYMGDNGFMFGEHGLIDKRVAYEPSIKVPMLMQLPGAVKGGQTIENVVANIDIAPTILEAAGIQKPEYMDGQSFLPLAQHKTIKWRDYFLYVYYWEKNFPQSPTMFALRSDKFKYITYYGLWDTDELYNIQDDPDEQYNLIAQQQYQPVIDTMKNTLFSMLADEGGMDIPMNEPQGTSSNKRLKNRGGQQAADFPKNLLLDKPEHDNAY